jgi:hypothetical protein
MPKFISTWTKRFEISEKRLDHCRKCDEYDNILRRCRKCGCFMDAKTLFPDAECPLEKWGKEPHYVLKED